METGPTGSYWKCPSINITNGGNIQCNFELYLDEAARKTGKVPFSGLSLNYHYDEAVVVAAGGPSKYVCGKLKTETAFANAKDILEGEAAEEIVQ